MQELMLTRDEVADRLKLAPSAVAGLVKRSACPLAPGRQVEGQRRWPQSEVLAAETWLAAQTEPAVRRAEPAADAPKKKSTKAKSKAKSAGKSAATAADAKSVDAKPAAAKPAAAKTAAAKPAKEARQKKARKRTAATATPAAPTTRPDARPIRIVETPAAPEPTAADAARSLWSEAAPGVLTAPAAAAPPVAAALPPMLVAPMQAMVRQMSIAVRETSRRKAFGPMTEWMLLGPVIMLNAMRAPLEAAAAAAAPEPDASTPDTLAPADAQRESAVLYAAGRLAS